MTLWPLLRLGALSADVGLRLDRLAAPLALLGLGLALLAARAAARALGTRRALAASLPLVGAVLLTLLADNLLLLCAGWGLSGLWAGGLAVRLRDASAPERTPLRARLWTLGRGGDLALLLGAALLFWSLGGTWSTAGRYLPDHDPDRPLPELATAAGPLPLGPTLRLREIEAQLGARDERGERPVADALRGKLLLGRPLLGALGACFIAAAAGRAAGAAALGGPLGALLLLEGIYLLARLRALLALGPLGEELLEAALLLGAALLAGALGPLAARLARALDRRLTAVRVPDDAPRAGAAAATAPAALRTDGDGTPAPADRSTTPAPATPAGAAVRGQDGRRGGTGAPALVAPGLLAPALLALLGAALLFIGLRTAAEGWPLPVLLLSPLLALLPRGADAGAEERPGRGAALAQDLAPFAPLLAALLCLSRFDPGHGVRDGGYGVQLALRLLPPVELALGVDGVAAALLPLAALLGGLALRAAPGRAARTPLVALLGSTLALLCAQDAALLVLAWLALVSAAAAWLARAAGRRAAAGLLGAGLASAALLGLALGLASAASVPPPLSDGTPAGHSLGLVPLSYLNYYGGQRLLWFPLSKVLFGLAALACAPLAALPPLHGWLAAALLASEDALLPAALLRAAAACVLLRVGYGLAPDAAVGAAEALSALGAAVALYGGLCLRGEADPGRRLGAAAMVDGGLCLLGLSAFTLTGLCGALLLLWAPLARSLSCRRPVLAAALGAPAGLGGLGWGAALVLFGALPGARLPTLVAGVGAWLAAPTRPGTAVTPGRPALLAAAAAALLALAPAAPLWPATTALRDLLTHTSGHLGAAALALLPGR